MKFDKGKKLMKFDKNSMLDYPYHDTVVKSLTYNFTENGDTNICMELSFCIEDLDQETTGVISSNGDSILNIKDCAWIKNEIPITSGYFIQIDFLEYVENSNEIKRLKLDENHWTHLKIVFCSGGVFECIMDSFELSKVSN